MAKKDLKDYQESLIRAVLSDEEEDEEEYWTRKAEEYALDPAKMPTPEQKKQFQRRLAREIHWQQRRKRRRLRARRRQGRSHSSHRILRKVASVVVFLTVGTLTLLYNTVEGFAASVDNFFTIVSPEAQELRITEKVGGDIEMEVSDFEGMYLPSWLPDGYEITEVNINNSYKSIYYKDQSETLITYYIVSDASSISVDNEEVISSTCYIHGIPGRVTEKDGKTRIVWEDSVYIYVLIGNTEIKNDLFTMAEETIRVEEDGN